MQPQHEGHERHIDKRWLIGGIVGAVLVVMLCCGGFAIVQSANQSKTVGTVQAPATSNPPTSTATKQAVKSAPTNTEVPRAGSGPANKVVLQVSGSGNKTTKYFTVQGDWTIAWSCQGGQFGGFIGIEVDSKGGDIPQDYLSGNCDAGKTNSDTAIEHDSGTYFLKVTALTPYTITVTDTDG